MLKKFLLLAAIVLGISASIAVTPTSNNLALLLGEKNEAETKNTASFAFSSSDGERFGIYYTNEVQTKLKTKKDPSSDSRTNSTSTSTSTPPKIDPPNPTTTTWAKCSDGTPQKQCTSKQPLFCKDGELKDRCSSCGCPQSTYCDEESERCLTAPIVPGIVPDNYEGRLQIFVYKTERAKKLFKKTTHTYELKKAFKEANIEVEAGGPYRVIIEIPDYEPVVIEKVFFPLVKLDEKWPKFLQNVK